MYICVYIPFLPRMRSIYQLTMTVLNYQRTVLSNVHCWENVETRVFTLLSFKRAHHLNRKMLFLGVFSLLFLSASAQKCFSDVNSACKLNESPDGLITLDDCSPDYLTTTFVTNFQTDLQKFAVENLYESFHLLYLSTYFGNYKVNREGFKKLYRHYSDKLWENSIDIIKYLTKRGGQMNFQQSVDSEIHTELNHKLVKLTEIKSLALVLDHMKELAKTAAKIHSNASLVSKSDPAIAHYIEEKFLGSYTDRIRDLSGYITELKELLYTKDTYHPNAVFLFDEYLQKNL